jgi:hypothetical protein
VGLFSANANSLNRLYRDRLDEAFELGNVKRYEGGRKQMALHTEQGLKLSDLNRPNVQSTRFRPYPIINAAMNMEGSSTEGHRSADFFIFTPDHIGCNSTGYVNTRLFEQERGGEPSLDLATATAISGAAVSSQMGQVGIPILAPTLALLNIRLGYWARNPSFFARGEFASRIRDWKIFYLFAEMFGRPSERNNKVYLTDGGHIDNLGVYQLLKRKCDVIIVVDAEADPAMTFGSLVDVERFARIDMGIRIELPFPLTAEAVSKRKAALKAGEHPTPRCGDWNHAVVGRILYPGRKDGLLLYIKAAVTGDEASYVLDYERRFPSFPHESTGDQFFTEEQFESYRALGFHAMDAGLRQTDGSDLWTNTLIEIRKKLGLSVNVEAIHSNPPVQAV